MLRVTPGLTTGPGFVPAGSSESGIVSAGMVGLPMAVTFWPSPNMGDDTTAGAGEGIAVDGAGAGAAGASGAGTAPVGAAGAGAEAVSGGADGVAGAAGFGGTGFGRIAIGGGSGGAFSPINGASQSINCSGSMAM